ncbi:MAG: patatin-like phospholipase family protein [Gammaproteobacteria bacterium]
MILQRVFLLPLLLACTLGVRDARAQAQAPAQAAPAPAARPRIALVLSGGGARGFAHIGVLRVLRELHVPVDIVVGTSMGSVIGGAYAAGASVAELESMARQTDWERVVADRPAREELEFRRREEDILLPSRIEFGVHRDGVSLPPAAAGNAALEHALTRLLPSGTPDRPVNQLALPFRSVASDLVTGELVELSDTPLFLTVRASLAVPGVFAPVRINGRLVVDGGLVRNLPIEMARSMGADVVIAVNVGTPLAPEKNLGSALGVAQQMINILTEQNVQRSLKELRPQDILLAPQLDGFSFLDFRRGPDAIAAGEAAARLLAERLAPLALDEVAYARFEEQRLAPPPSIDRALAIAEVRAETDGQINPAILTAQSGLKEGSQATRAQVESAAQSLYGRGDLERVETEIVDQGEARKVNIKVTEAPWASSRLRVGLELGTDFDETNDFAIKLMHVKTSLNSWGGELRTVLRVGDQREYGIQWHQPLGPGSPWYVAPQIAFSSGTYDVFDQGRRQGRVASHDSSASLVFGRELGSWGDIQMMVQRARVASRVAIPDLGLSGRGLGTVYGLRYRIDTLDSLGFPSRGALLDVELDRAHTDWGKRESDTQSAVVAMAAFHTQDWAGHVYGEYAHGQQDSAPVRLGGFLRLSGTAANSIDGGSIAFSRLVMARRIGALPVTLGGTVRAGFSLEAGGAFERKKPPQGAPFKQAGSAFLSVDTRFGPLYLGGGATRDGDRTLYIYLGPIW